MVPRTGRFERADRLLRSSEFERVARRGRRVAARYFVVLVGPSEGSGRQRRRLGVTVSRRVGNAVVRNRLKRRIREWFRAAREQLAPGTEVVVIARAGASELSSAETAAALEDLVRSLEVGLP